MNVWQDVRYALRMLANAPGYALTAVFTIALGIGATTAIFSVADAMLWKPSPLPAIDRLVLVAQRPPDDPEDWDSATPADLDDIRHGNTSLGDIASWQYGQANLAGPGSQPERVQQAITSANYFDVVGVQPALGRGFQPGDDRPGREHEAVLSDRLWRRRYGAEPGVIGRTIRIDDENYVVTGVMPPSFDFPIATEIYTPMALTPAQRTSRTASMLVSIARLKPGISIGQADAEIANIGKRLEKDHPDTNRRRQYTVMSALRVLIDRETRQYVLLLVGSVLFVLLIACANVANLQFARATGRLREVAVRTALGASRWRVMTQLITESVVLSLGGAALGLAIAWWGVRMIRQGMPAEVERYILGWKDMHIDGRALVFTLLAAVASGILAGLAPAWQCSRPNLTGALREGGRGTSVGRGRHRLRNLLVAGEIALAVVLLVGAGLMVRGFQSMVARGAELEPSRVLMLQLAITESKYKEDYRVAAFYQQVVERIQSLPGVQTAAAVTAMPYSNHWTGRDFTIEGRPVEPGNQPSAMYQVSSPGYFAAVHVPLRAGRLLQESDTAKTLPVAVVSERLAQFWWNKESPLGKRIRIAGADKPWLTIVGVVGDITRNPYDREPRRTIYASYQQAPERFMDIGLRAFGDPLRLAPAVTAAIRAVDPEQPVTDMRTMEKAIRNTAIGLNYVAVLMGVLGAIALLLSTVGVYGVMAYVVSEQTHDIGLRMALGASRGSVLGMVFRRCLTTTGGGLAVGLVLAFGLARLLASLIYGVTATDAITFVGIPLTLLAAVALAAYVPARRAMRIDPIVALRYE